MLQKLTILVRWKKRLFFSISLQAENATTLNKQAPLPKFRKTKGGLHNLNLEFLSFGMSNKEHEFRLKKRIDSL